MSQPHRGVGVIVRLEDKILLGKRTQPRPGYTHCTWELPGGKPSSSIESIYATAFRELHEETGLLLQDLNIIHKHEHVEEGENWITYGVLGTAQGTPQVREDIIGEWTYMNPTQLTDVWHVSQEPINTYLQKFHMK